MSGLFGGGGGGRGGAKAMLAPHSQIIGGPGPPSSYAYEMVIILGVPKFRYITVFVKYTGGGGSLIYIDPSNLRRSTTVTTATTVNQETPVNMATTVSQLGRAFGIVVRQIADLLTMLQDYHALAPTLPRTLDISDQEASDLQVKLFDI